MPSRQPLHRRIILACTLLTLAVSGVFSLGIVAVVHFVEAHLVSQELRDELDSVMGNYLAEGLPPRLDARTSLYASHMPGYEIPSSYADLPAGFNEVVNAREAVYVYVRDSGQQRYVLVQEQADFESRENALFAAVLGGFVLSVLFGALLGWLVARRVMAPVIRLSSQVRHRDQLLTLAPELAADYPNDEVGDLAAAFDATLGQLRQALERERLFTGDVSHELRTPLMIIASSAELLDAADLDPRAQRQVARIRRAVDEVSGVVETFLLLARASGEAQPLPGDSLLAAVAETQRARWQRAFEEKGLRFELQTLTEDDGLYHGGLLSTVMSNLLRNALHYTDNGTVRLVLERGGFRVEDSGQGVPSAEQGAIFQPFVRGSEARGEGLGLGLSLVKRICIHQGWTVDMHLLEPNGSCFEVILTGSD